MSDSEVRDEVITFSMTGFETVGESLTWTLSLLAQHPEVDARVTAEARAFDPEAPVTPHGPDLPYIRAVVQESLRLYPPTWIYGRLALAKDTLPSGVTVQHHETHVWRLEDGRLVEGKTHLDREMSVTPC